MRQLEKIPNVDAISMDNINILSKRRIEYKVPILEEAPVWLERRSRNSRQGRSIKSEGQRILTS